MGFSLLSVEEVAVICELDSVNSFKFAFKVCWKVSRKSCAN
jgi:hypothetical protein